MPRYEVEAGIARSFAGLRLDFARVVHALGYLAARVDEEQAGEGQGPDEDDIEQFEEAKARVVAYMSEIEDFTARMKRGEA